jgi:hypothetical protein
MHFRHVDDEILFGSLKAQLIQSLQGAPPHMLTNVLRALGRIESIAFYEGVRQGAVARAIEDTLHVRRDGLDTRPIAQHARVYSGGFTPLTAAEERYVERLMKDEAATVWEEIGLHDDLVAEPLEMPPMTLAEALASPNSSLTKMAKRAEAAETSDPTLLTTIFAAEAAAACEAFPAPVAGFPPTGHEPEEHWLSAMLMHGKDADPVAPATTAYDLSMLRTDGSKRVTEQPSFIERCRDVLQTRMLTGWGPVNWTDIVFAIRDDLQADPFAIDLNLSTDVGKNMLRSIGLFEIADTVLDAMEIDAMLRSGSCVSST